MKIGNTHYRSIWLSKDGWPVHVIDQTKLPHAFEVLTLQLVEDAARAIVTMQVRGAPLIAMTGAYGMALAMRKDNSDTGLERAYQMLLHTRPTAINLRHALDEMRALLLNTPAAQREKTAYAKASAFCDEDIAINEAIGKHGLALIEAIAKRKGHTVNILTHCNAGWIATVDWGTALAPIYMAHDKGISVHVWVDETRPRLQGALTAWELGEHGVPHTLIVDNAGGHLMQQGLVDLCIVGTDRVTANGDVCNKIGTYLKALAAHDNGVPFYVALPSPTIDWETKNGQAVPIEERDARELAQVTGMDESGKLETVRIFPADTNIRNDAFDVTPARLVTGLITERGVCEAAEEGLKRLFSKLRKVA